MQGTRLTEHTFEEHRTVRIERRISASPDRVFDAWLDPNKVDTWMLMPGPGEVTSIELDPSIGGSFAFVVRGDGASVQHEGQYLAIERPRHLSFTWKVPSVSLEASVVTIDLTPVGENETDVILQHEGVLADDEKATEEGWSSILDAFSSLLAVEDTEITAPHRTQDIH